MTTNPEITDRRLQQVVVPLSRKPKNQELLPLSKVASLAEGVLRDSQKGWEAVFNLAVAESGLFESEIADALEMDKGNFSKLKAGGLQHHRLHRFCQAVGNVIVLQVDAYLAGAELRPLESALESENRKLREQVAELERRRQIEIDLIRELREGK